MHNVTWNCKPQQVAGRKQTNVILLQRNLIVLNVVSFFLPVSLYVLQRGICVKFYLKTWSAKTKQKKQLVWSFALNSWFVAKLLRKKDYSIQVQRVLTDQVCNQVLLEPVREFIPWIVVLTDHAEVCLFFSTEMLGDIMLIQTECNFCYFYICDIKMTLHCYTATQLPIGGKKSGTYGNCWVKPLKVTLTLVMLMILGKKCFKKSVHYKSSITKPGAVIKGVFFH